MNTQKNQKGFSLVEMLVSSVISMIIGGVIYTIFFMYSNQAGASVSMLLMQQQYDNVSRQISQDIRRASYVLGPGETSGSFSAGFDTVTSIVMCDRNGVVIAQYAINAAQLTEGSQQVPFQAGGSTVKIVDGASNFILGPQRRSVTINLSLLKRDHSATHTIAARKDVFQCRNRI
jgi:prepilin-type N-terminal cleavage/methylation domain-containing protein